MDGFADTPLPNPEPLSGERLLLIEGDRAIARSLVLLLGSTGFAVDVAEDADRGVSLSASGDYKIVLLGPSPPTLARGSLAAELRLSRIDQPTRFLSVSAAPGATGDMQITPFP